MLEQIDPFYHGETILMFQMIQTAVRPLSPIAMSFSDDDPEDAFSRRYSMSPTEVVKRHGQVVKRLKARTAGLVEICQTQDSSSFEVDEGNPNEYAEQLLYLEVQYLHLTVKEFLRSSGVPAWLATQISQVDASVHLKIAACSLQHIQVAQLLGHGILSLATAAHLGQVDQLGYGVSELVLFHAREVERAAKKSQLRFFEALGEETTSSDHGLQSINSNLHQVVGGGRDWRWLLSRYNKWREPEGWLSDHVCYLAAIGMTHSVIDILNDGYDAAKKRGRPLLLYATCCVAPDDAIGDLERDTIDSLLVRELLERNCDPNQVFVSKRVHRIRDKGAETVWEAVLQQLGQRFGSSWPGTDAAQRHEAILEQDCKAMHSLKLRWLETIKLFLDHGANPAQCVVTREHVAGRRWKVSRESGLLIFNRVFSDFNHALVQPTRQLMVLGGGNEIEETWSDSSEEEFYDFRTETLHRGQPYSRRVEYPSQIVLGKLADWWVRLTK